MGARFRTLWENNAPGQDREEVTGQIIDGVCVDILPDRGGVHRAGIGQHKTAVDILGKPGQETPRLGQSRATFKDKHAMGRFHLRQQPNGLVHVEILLQARWIDTDAFRFQHKTLCVQDSKR